MAEVTSVLALIGSMISIFTVLIGLGWWFRSLFADIRRSFYISLKEHGDTENQRHRENMEKFERIFVALARLEKEK